MVTMEHNNNPTIKQPQTIAVQGWKSCLKLTILNLNHFNMVQDMVLKLNAWRSPERHHLSAKYHEDLPSGSKIISGVHTDWFEKPTFIFWKVG
jgi:hypothetical protein